jgi:hypothetical protein
MKIERFYGAMNSVSVLTVLAISFLFSCASEKARKETVPTLEQRLAPTTIWKTYDPGKKSDLAFTALMTKMERGYKLLVSGDSIGAYYEFDAILSDPKFIKYNEYLYSKFYLAEALHQMNAKYGALLYFVDILKKEESKPYLEESLKRAIAIAQDLKDDGLILYLATILTPDKIAPSMREEFRFFIAKNFYLNNTFENSKILFKAITPQNRLYMLAQYYLGVMAVQEDNFKPAIKNFATISSLENPEYYYEWEHLSDLANMNIARLLYESGQLKKSVDYYNEVPKESELYAEATYEASWSLYNWGKFNAALSTLHTLQSPFYEITYFPRSILLKGAIFLELCMYKDAIIALKNLEEYYSELKGLMDSFYAQAKSRSDYYQLLTGPENIRGDSFSNPYRKLFQLASANRDFLQMHRFVKELSSELRILARLKDNKRANFLSDHIQKKKDLVSKKAVNLAIDKIQLTRKTILDYLKSADVVRLEIVTAERKLLEDKVKGYGKTDSTDINIEAPIQSSIYIQDNYNFYKFTGEYWKDELGYYLYNIESQCVSADAR